MDALGYARELIPFESSSRLSNAAVTDHVEGTLKRLGFATERVDYGDAFGVRKSNVIGRLGGGSGGLALFGHTDVVPADDWSFPGGGPWQPTIADGRLYGRGSCDMKGSVACMLAAAERFSHTSLTAPLYIVCTADEEIGYVGAKQVVANSTLFAEMLRGGTCGVIGEPTKLQVVHGHKGTVGLIATSRGRAAHSSTREGLNANLAMIPYLVEMKKLYEETEQSPRWHNHDFDPPTICWNIGINDHTRAVNITPPQSVCTVYMRPMPGLPMQELIDRARQAAERYGLEFDAVHQFVPLFLDPQSSFVQSVLKLAGQAESRTVGYGTDGSIFSVLKNLVVLGPGDIAQAHTADEWIALDQLTEGTDLFSKLIEYWCCRS